MPSREESVELLKARGLVPLFPLPNIVLFPRAALPLHIFEPRYRRMTEDALRYDRLIAMALLKPGWEERYHGNPEVHPIACAGVIEDEATLPDGRFNIRLRGLARVEILGFVRETPYRMAAIRGQVRQKLLVLGDDLKEVLWPAFGPEFHSHVASHLRRRTNPPHWPAPPALFSKIEPGPGGGNLDRTRLLFSSIHRS